jgi:oxygen-independent coproporphyrinogen-3 oxidase
VLPIENSEKLNSSQIENERLMLSIRLTSGIETNSLNQTQIQGLSGYLNSGHLDQYQWDRGKAILTVDGRLIADKILREILL